MTALRKPERMDIETFLDFAEDRPDHERWELFDGVPQILRPHTLRHATMCTNLTIAILPHVRASGGEVFGRNLLVSDPANRYFAAIPDLMVRSTRAGRMTDCVIFDPTILIEIISPSTKARDLADKFIAYTAIASLKVYEILFQDEMRAEVWQRRPADTATTPVEVDDAPQGRASGRGWDNHTLTRATDILALDPIDASLTLAQIYEDTDLVA